MLYLGAMLSKDDLSKYSGTVIISNALANDITALEEDSYSVRADLAGIVKLIPIPFIFAFATSGSDLLLLSFVSSGGKYNYMRFISGISLLLIVPYIFFDVSDPRKDWFTTLKEETFKCVCPESLNFSSTMSSEKILNCIYLNLGLDSSLYRALAASKYLSLLPAVGAFQGIFLSLCGVIRLDNRRHFFNELYQGSRFSFPFAEKQYSQHLQYFLYGALLFNLFGMLLFIFMKTPLRKTLKIEPSHEYHPRTEEVAYEKEKVFGIIQPILQEASSTYEELEGGQVVYNYTDADFQQDAYNSFPPILTYELQKVYSTNRRNPNVIALKSLDLAIPKGEICALLGNNGSGKTTILSILSASDEASAGLAFVESQKLNRRNRHAIQSLGSCPQHDMLWESASVKAHLELFASIVGIPRKHVVNVSVELARALGLGEEKIYNLAVRKLSGGMKRRLSLALALIGTPSVLLLDEPSTGLDPINRQKVWSLISSYSNQDKSVLITTHMVEEAEVLSDRIAILSKGELQVIGSKQKLKEKYGDGYILNLHLMCDSNEHREEAIHFVQERIHHAAYLARRRQVKTLYFYLPNDIDISSIIRVLYGSERYSKGGIDQFSLSQASLEHIYFTFCDGRNSAVLET